MKTPLPLLAPIVGLCAAFSFASASPGDEAQMKRNAAEQAGALGQDPGGADREGLLKAKLHERILAGTPETRTAHPDAQWFGSASLGLFVHWGIASVHGEIDLSWPMILNMGGGKKVTPAAYWGLADRFRPDRFQPAEWLRAARAAGFDYAVLTAKHHDGYTLWPSETTDLGTRTHLGGRDLVGEFVAACRATGLKVGLYYSGPDWWLGRDHMSFNYRSEGPGGGNSSLPPIPGRPAFDVNHQPATIPVMPPETRARLGELARRQLVELLTRYGKIDLLWFDGGSGSDITLEEIRALQPGIVINNRGNLRALAGGPAFPGDYFTVEHGEQPVRPPGWWEQLRIWNSPTWGYQKRNEERYTSSAAILRLLARTKGWGGALLANVGPRPDGSLPPPFYDGVARIEGWMSVNGESIHGATALPPDAEANVPVTVRGETWYLHAVAGSEGRIVVKPGPSVAGIVSARVLGEDRPVPFAWQDGALTLDFPEPARDRLHLVIAARVSPR